VISGRRLHVMVEVVNAVAVDVFSLGATLCFMLSNGSLPFRGDLASSTIERNIQMDAHGVNDIHRLTAEAKHMVALMVSYSPGGRPTTSDLLKHPLFWSIVEKVRYLGETVGAALPIRFDRKANPFVLQQVYNQSVVACDSRAFS
jgi:serine/threonine protein kinase